MSNPFEIQNSEIGKHTEPQVSNFFLDAYNLCAKHPVETIGTAVGIAASAALAIRNPLILNKLAGTGMLSKIEAFEAGFCTKLFGAGVKREFTAAERVDLGVAFIKQSNGNATAKLGEFESIKDIALNPKLLGAEVKREHTAAKLSDYAIGNKQIHNMKYLETVFPDGRKITTFNTGGRLKIEHPDGTEFAIYRNGSASYAKKPDGTFISNDNGRKSIHWPNATSLDIDTKGTRRLFFDREMYVAEAGKTDWRRFRPDDNAPPIDDQVKKAIEPWLTADPVSEELAKLLAKLFQV